MLRRGSAVLLSTVLAMSMIATACGDDDKATSSGATQTTSDKPAPTGDPIIIGIQTDETGGAAPYNVGPSKLVKALIERQNSNGGLLGRPIEIVEGNDESDPTKAPTVFQDLADKGAKVMFLHTGGAAIIQTKPLTKKLELPVFASTNSTDAVQGPPDNEYIYTLGLPTSVWGDVYCNGMKNAGIKTVGLLRDDTPTIAAFSEGVLKTMTCVEIVATESAAVNAADLSAQVARLKDAKPDAIVTFSQGNTFEITAQNALYEQMPDTPRFMTATFGNSPDEWKVANAGALEGAVFMATVDPENKRSKEVEADMHDLMGDDFVMNQFTAQTYDAYALMVKAVEAAGTDEPAKVNEAIQGISGYKASYGLPGLTLSYGPDKHNAPDSDCGLLLVQFGKNNKPKGVYPDFKPDC